MAKQARHPEPWRNRIVGYSDEPTDSMLASPWNWRIHSHAQENALAGVLHEVGLVQNIICNRTTGHVVDGHLRVGLALTEGQPTVPVTWVELTEDEERLVLATIDPLSAMASTDAAKLGELLADVRSGDAAVQAMLAELAKANGLEYGKPEAAEDVGSAPPLPAGKYAVIYADPPWSYSNSGFGQSAASHYLTMSTEDICAMPIADKCTPDSVLFLWGTSPLLPDALKVCAAWGFSYKASMIWDKGRAPGLGWFVQTEHEYLLIATMDANTQPREKPKSIIHATPTKHSAKPHAFYEIIEKMYAGPYMELFARNQRDGWAAWGNQVPL